MKCPKCDGEMLPMLLRSAGITAVEEDLLAKMWEVNESGGYVDGGTAYIIIPMKPNELKYVKCTLCVNCEYVCFCRADIIPSDQVPQVAK